jgi:hypothetical protein
MWLYLFFALLLLTAVFLPLLPITLAVAIMWAHHARTRARRLRALRQAAIELERKRV